MTKLRPAMLLMTAVLVTGMGVAYLVCDHQLSAQSKTARSELSGKGLSSHHGIDVSCHSGAVDWHAVARQGFGFAFVKATEGNDLKDPSFESHWAQLKAAGIRRGAYHFYVTEDEPETQAQFFIENVPLEPGDLAPVVDVELIGHNTPPGLTGRLQRWLDIIERHYGVKPIIYTTARFWNQHLSAEFGAYPLWVAEYDVDRPRIPDGWAKWHLWQYKGDTAVAGVEKGADVSRVNQAGVELAELVVAGE